MVSPYWQHPQTRSFYQSAQEQDLFWVAARSSEGIELSTQFRRRAGLLEGIMLEVVPGRFLIGNPGSPRITRSWFYLESDPLAAQANPYFQGVGEEAGEILRRLYQQEISCQKPKVKLEANPGEDILHPRCQILWNFAQPTIRDALRTTEELVLLCQELGYSLAKSPLYRSKQRSPEVL